MNEEVFQTVMRYADDVNTLTPIEDREEHLRLFEEIDKQLAAILPTEKNENVDIHIRYQLS
jgi:hypothetical protein